MAENARNVTVAGLGCEYWVSSADAPRVLFVHGASHGSWCWERFGPYFARRGWEGWAVNLPGHHLTPEPSEFPALRLSDYVHALERACQHIRPDALCGHSMGGLLTLKLLERGIAGAGVVVTPVAPGSQGAQQMSRVLASFAEAGDQPPQGWFARERVFGRLSPPDRDRFVALFGREPDSVNVDLVTGALEVERLPVGTRLLVVGCDADPIAPVESLRGLAPSLAGEYLNLSGMGHEPMLEPGWEHAADAILAWLTQPNTARRDA